MAAVHFRNQVEFTFPTIVVNKERADDIDPVNQTEEGAIAFGADSWIEPKT
jgi:hypothetical protein